MCDTDIQCRHVGEMARDIAVDGAAAEGLSRLGCVAKIALPTVLLSSCRGIGETASTEVACDCQASSPAEIHLLLEASI